MHRPSRSVLILWGMAVLLLLAGAWAGRAQDGVPSPPAFSTGVSPGPEFQAPQASPPVTRAPAAREWTVDSLDTPLLERLRSLGGLLLIGLLAWSLSVDRRRIPWRVVGWGLALQFGFALFILKTPMGAGLFALLNTLVVALLGFTVEGARFIFGDLVFNTVPVGVGEPGMAPMEETPGMVAQTGAFFAFNVLPTIIFFSSLMSLFYHVGVMQILVKGMAWVMQRTMGTSGAETLSAAGNIFVGQTEAPLLVKPFVARMTNSELMAVMTGGFATVAGGVLAAFVGMLVAYFPDIAGHLIAASVMSAPAALVVAKIMVPEDGEPETATGLGVDPERRYVNSIDAAAGGAAEGLHLALNVGAMLLAFIALIAMFNATYALSGFANFSSIAIQIGGIGGIAPQRRQDLSRLGLRAMVAGSLAAFMTATIAGMLL